MRKTERTSGMLSAINLKVVFIFGSMLWIICPSLSVLICRSLMRREIDLTWIAIMMLIGCSKMMVAPLPGKDTNFQRNMLYVSEIL